MKKTIVAITAAAFLGGATLTPTPAAAFVFAFFPAVMAANYNPNFKAVNPYDKPVKMSKRMKKRH